MLKVINEKCHSIVKFDSGEWKYSMIHQRGDNQENRQPKQETTKRRDNQKKRTEEKRIEKQQTRQQTFCVSVSH